MKTIMVKVIDVFLKLVKYVFKHGKAAFTSLVATLSAIDGHAIGSFVKHSAERLNPLTRFKLHLN